MGSVPKLALKVSASQLFNNGGVLFMVWIASGLAVALVLYLMIEPLVAWMRRRRAIARLGGAEVLEEPDFAEPSASKWGNYVEAACRRCENTVYVPKSHQCRPFLCPNCAQMNPALKKEIMRPVKRFMRWLLYPSFQNRF